jgi:hypothetical protein
MDNIEFSRINVKRNLRTKHKEKKKNKIKIDLKYKYIDIKEIPA